MGVICNLEGKKKVTQGVSFKSMQWLNMMDNIYAIIFF